MEMRKLNKLASVLYVAAHPDDENTRLIAYLANGELATTTYLSLTRGDGGQNLLGSDLGERLGIIRTQELLAARRIDGGHQRFSRAVDFGYSKTPEETLQFWGKESILGDLVWTIRLTRPDVIITRFSPEPGSTHGHHTASAQLATEAFTAAADPNRFPEQLEYVEPWQAKRILWNTGSWSFSRDEFEKERKRFLAVDTGGYNPLLGAAYSEIAADSRSAHKTQGFGSTARLGEAIEYFAPLDGEPAPGSLLEGIDTSWGRVPEAAPVAASINRAIEAFSPEDPARSVPFLIEAHRLLSALPDMFWKTRKLADLERVLAACIGLDVESLSAKASAIPGSDVGIEILAIQRSPLDVQIALEDPDTGQVPEVPVTMAPNELVRMETTVHLPSDGEISQPYWLREGHPYGRYTIRQQAFIGLPENPAAIPVRIRLTIDGYPLTCKLPTAFKFNDPVHGEVKEPFVIEPAVMVNLPESPLIFNGSTPATLTAKLLVRTDISGGELRFTTGDGWKVEPENMVIGAKAGEEISVAVRLFPPEKAGRSQLSAEVVIDGTHYSRGYERIAYDHIPVQTLFPEAAIQIIRLDVKTTGQRVGYIPGAGDAIPEALQRMGYQVEALGEADLVPERLSGLDAVVLGIRAVNTIDRIDAYLPALFSYAKEGGVVILQYNTSRGLKTNNFSPYPLTLSRDRVTDETAEVRIIAPDHPVLNVPNRITSEDFAGWVQERGLYFASEWDPAFTPVFSMNDPSEPPSEGSLLVARHGDGWFVYSGLSWFRQLPAGVPGAYRLFANVVSLGSSE